MYHMKINGEKWVKCFVNHKSMHRANYLFKQVNRGLKKKLVHHSLLLFSY